MARTSLAPNVSRKDERLLKKAGSFRAFYLLQLRSPDAEVDRGSQPGVWLEYALPMLKNKEESHLRGSLDHQGASNSLIITFRDGGRNPFFMKS